MQRDRADTDLAPDYNVAPTKKIYAVLTRNSGSPQDSAPASDEPAERQLRVVRWGLVPYWAKDRAIGSRMINARAETVADKPAYRRAFARRRCLLPADGFYEWQQVADGGGKRKQPYYIYRSDGGVLAFAGLYELWRDPSVPEDSPDSWLWTATIITTRAQDQVGQIHDRMPMVIEPSAWADWLDPGLTATADVAPLLVPASSGALTSYPVSTAVNNVRNNGPELREPLPEPGAVPEPGTTAGSSSTPGPQPRPSGAHPPDGAPAGSGGSSF